MRIDDFKAQIEYGMRSLLKIPNPTQEQVDKFSDDLLKVFENYDIEFDVVPVFSPAGNGEFFETSIRKVKINCAPLYQYEFIVPLKRKRRAHLKRKFRKALKEINRHRA